MDDDAPLQAAETQHRRLHPNQQCQRTDSRDSPPVELWIGFAAGILSGAIKLAIGHPFDTIKVRMQTQGAHARFTGPLDCLKTTIRHEGFRALYKGATPPLVGWAIMDSVQMGSLTNFRLLLQNGDTTIPLTTGQHAVAGFGAGMVVSFVAAPIELVKTKLQVQYDAATKVYAGPVDCARKILNRFGVAGLWTGLSACLLFRSFFWVLWGSYDIYTKKLTETGMDASLVPFFAGALAANTFWTVSFPADVIKQRMMTQPDTIPRIYPSITSCARHIWRTQGIRGFYRGFLPCFLRSAPTNGAALFVYEHVYQYGKAWNERR